MNVIQVAGNLGSDPVVRFTPSGQKVTTFNVASNHRKGEATTTIWYRITIWGERFDKMITYLKKGGSIIVVGELQEPRIWTDKEGKQQIQLEVYAEMLRFSPFGSGKSAAEKPQQEQSSGSNFSEQAFQGNNGGSQRGKQQNQEALEEEELPF